MGQNEVLTNMRLDKFLKVSMIIKRRTVAAEICNKGRVLINDKVAKASSDVKIGDIIEIKFGDKITKFKVLDIKGFAKKEDTSSMYELI